MSLYKHIREAWKKPKESDLWHERLIAWRQEPTTVVLEHPTRIDRARSLGYKAKQGIVVVRSRVLRGGHTKPSFSGGRRSKRFGKRLPLRKNYQLIAEERAQKEHTNLTVLNSYWVAEDGNSVWYEVILIDPSHPVIKSDPNLKWICHKKHLRRVIHGKTSAGKKMRGMRTKGIGAEKSRPSRGTHMRN